MHTTVENYIGPRDCRYKWRGVNIVNLRRVQLYKLAQCFRLGTPASTKNQLLTMLIGRLDAMNAVDDEISALIKGDANAD